MKSQRITNDQLENHKSIAGRFESAVGELQVQSENYECEVGELGVQSQRITNAQPYNYEFKI